MERGRGKTEYHVIHLVSKNRYLKKAKTFQVVADTFPQPQWAPKHMSATYRLLREQCPKCLQGTGLYGF